MLNTNLLPQVPSYLGASSAVLRLQGLCVGYRLYDPWQHHSSDHAQQGLLLWPRKECQLQVGYRLDTLGWYEEEEEEK